MSNLKPGGRYNEFAHDSPYFTLVAADALDEVFENFEEVSPSATRVKVYATGTPSSRRQTGLRHVVPTLLNRNYPEPVTFADLAYEFEDLWRTAPDELGTCPPTRRS